MSGSGLLACACNDEIKVTQGNAFVSPILPPHHHKSLLVPSDPSLVALRVSIDFRFRHCAAGGCGVRGGQSNPAW